MGIKAENNVAAKLRGQNTRMAVKVKCAIMMCTCVCVESTVACRGCQANTGDFKQASKGQR